MGGEGDLPGAGAAGAQVVGDGVVVQVGGGAQHRRRTRSGSSRFSVGTWCSSAIAVTAGLAAASRAAAAGSRVPRTWRGRGVGARGVVREVPVRQGQGRLQGGEVAHGVGRSGAAGEAGDGAQLVDGLREPGRRFDDGRVGQYAAGGHVAAAGEFVAAFPERADYGEVARFADAVHAGGPAPRFGARLGGGGGADGLEFLQGPVELALRLELVVDGVAEVYQELHVECGVLQPGSGSGRVDQSSAEWPFSRW